MRIARTVIAAIEAHLRMVQRACSLAMNLSEIGVNSEGGRGHCPVPAVPEFGVEGHDDNPSDHFCDLIPFALLFRA